MSKISKIALGLCIALLFLSIFMQNDIILSLSISACFFLLSGSKIMDELSRGKRIREIKNNNTYHIIVKENNKLSIILIPFICFNCFIIVKSRYNMYIAQSQNPSTDLVAFLTSLNFSDKLLMLTTVGFAILAVVYIIQGLFSHTIVSKDEVIFYDGTIFNISELDDIEYDKWSISKNKKVIQLGKGLLDKKIIVNKEDFEKVKNILEIKNKS